MSYPSLPSIRAFDAADKALDLVLGIVGSIIGSYIWAKRRQFESVLHLDKYLQGIFAINLVAAAISYLVLTTMMGLLAIYLSLVFTIMTAFVLSANIYFKRSWYFYKLRSDAKWQKRREDFKKSNQPQNA